MTQAMLLFGEGVRQRQKREAVGECSTHREVALITRSTFFSSATTASAAAATTTGGCRAIRASLT